MSDDVDLVRKATALWWPNLPTLLLGSVMVAAAWAVLRGLSDGGWLAVVAIALLVLPLQAALVDTCATLLGDDHVGSRGLLRRLPTVFLRTWRVAVPIAAAALLVSAAAAAWHGSGQVWALLSWAVCSAVLAVVAAVGVVALPYALRSGDSWRRVWLIGSFLASRSPLVAVGLVAACGLAVWAASHLSFALLLLLPAPLALVWAAGAAEATRRGRRRLDSRTHASV